MSYSSAFGSPSNPSSAGYTSGGVSYSGTTNSGSYGYGGGGPSLNQPSFWGKVKDTGKNIFNNSIYGKAYNAIKDSAAKNPNTGAFYSTYDHSSSPYYQGGDSSTFGTPTATQPGYQTTQTTNNPTDYQGALDKLQSMISGNSQNNTFLTTAQDRVNEIMNPEYQAYSPDELDRMYNYRSDNLRHDVIEPQNEQLAAKLAISGQTGGGIAGKNWEDKSYYDKRLLSDMYNEIQDKNLTQTTADQNQAFSMLPSLYGIESQNEQQPINNWVTMAQLLKDKYGIDQGIQETQQQSQGDLIGGLVQAIPAILSLFG